MAEMAVSFAIDQLLPLLTEEINLLKGVHKEFADIKDELESIQAFLKDADRRAAVEGDNTSEGIKTWVKQVREVAFRIEDVIDDYMIHVGQTPRDARCVALLHKISRLFKHMIPRHRIATEIQDIKSTVCGIKERSERYAFQIQPFTEQRPSSLRKNQNTKWHDPRMAALYVDEAEIVGFQDPKNRLINWLVGREERTVISVVGMGGQGKTTLVKKVLESKEHVRHFECLAWITVSQSYHTEGLLRDMLKKVYKQKGDSPPEDISEMDRGSLISELRNYLQQKRYVFVFDDVWDIHFWDEIENALIDSKNGSKIFITTRNMHVAMSCKKSAFIEVYELQPLTEEQSFELFNKKAFRFDFDGSCPKELIDVSFEIARKCKGLPLAIVAIGGLLSTKKKNAIEWRRFSENMTLELKKDSHLTGINKILGFSYDDLPLYLKSCLLYFGIYPEDYEIKSKRLIRQWIAEGFVKEERGVTLEEVAEGYLSELIHRSLVQVSSVRIDGKTKSCCVHDLLRLVILEKCEDLSFSKHISEDGMPSSLNGIIRRLSIATNSNDVMECIENSHVRSLFLFTNESKCLDKYFVSKILTKHRSLKVLDCQGAMLRTLHKNLGSLIHLKYLSFKNSFIEEGQLKFPKSIGLLQNLETLDLRTTHNFYEIPSEIGKLRKLRHFMGCLMSSFQLKGAGIGGMESLQTLSEVTIDNGGTEFITELGKLWQLRKLGLVGVLREHGSALSSLLNELRHLEKLCIVFEVIDLHFVSFPPTLQNLRLHGKLEKFPLWVPQLPNLVELKLEKSRLPEDPINNLENMQNLLSLSIINCAYEGESLHFHDGGFQNLKELHIRKLYNLSSIIIENGALHSLEMLDLSRIPILKTVSVGTQCFGNLKDINIWDVPLAEFHHIP